MADTAAQTQGRVPICVRSTPISRPLVCGCLVIAFQVLAGLGAVTLISPENVSFAESRRDALKAIAK